MRLRGNLKKGIKNVVSCHKSKRRQGYGLLFIAQWHCHFVAAVNCNDYQGFHAMD